MVVGRTVLVDRVLGADVIRRLVDIDLPSPLEAEAVAAEGVHDDHAGRRRPVERTRPTHNDNDARQPSALDPSEVWKRWLDRVWGWGSRTGIASCWRSLR